MKKNDAFPAPPLGFNHCETKASWRLTQQSTARDTATALEQQEQQADRVPVYNRFHSDPASGGQKLQQKPGVVQSVVASHCLWRTESCGLDYLL